MAKLSRIADNAYASIESGSRVKHLTVRASRVDSERQFLIAEAALSSIGKMKPDGKSHTVRFSVEGQKWKVVRMNEHSLLQRLIRHFNPFKIKPTEGQFERYVIQKAHRSIPKQNHTERTLKTDIRLPVQRVSKTEFEKKVRGALPLEKGSLTPFTKLAAFASQRLERKLHMDDQQTFADLDYRLIVDDGKLKLVHKTSEYATVENLNAAVEVWKNEYIAAYGENKFNEICSFYELDFESGLTAEHIFRANIGASNVEFKDIIDFVSRVKYGQQLTGREERLLREDEYLRMFIDGLNSNPEAWEESDVSRLASAYMFSEAEKEEAYTGRKIVLPIASNYTVAGLTKYKPWIDQQELLQIFSQLPRCKSWESYQEFLSHVVVKKHLLRIFETGPRLGALIPAPPLEKDRQPRYYTVVGCITNGGTLSYILESPVKDPTLPTIKLYRSTTLDSYALQWSDTIMNDFNHLHSPGYLGMHYLDPYEREFIKAHTLPLWSAYVELASTKTGLDQNDDLEDLLDKAKECYLESFKAVERPSFAQILKNHDKPLNSLFFPYASDTFGAFLKSKKNDVLGQMIEKHVHGMKQPNANEVHRDARRLVEYLNALQIADPILKHQIDSLIQELNQHILNPPSQNAEIEPLIPEGLEGKELLRWFQEKQRELKERPEDKRAVNLEFAGHSLGGSCAAAAVARYLAVDGRVPLPGKSLNAYFFDEPGVDEEDNQAFLQYGAKHHELFKAMDVKFSIYRRHEARDVITTAGEMGLGSVSTQEEQDTLTKWLTFNAAVNHRVKTAHHLEVSETIAPHATRFGEGEAKVKKPVDKFKKTKKIRPGKDFVEYQFTPLQEGIFHRGTNQKLKGKEEKRIYRQLYTKLWALSGKLEKIFREQARKSFLMPFQLLRFALAKGGDQKHVLPKEMKDENGAFVMHGDVIITQQS